MYAGRARLCADLPPVTEFHQQGDTSHVYSFYVGLVEGPLGGVHGVDEEKEEASVSSAPEGGEGEEVGVSGVGGGAFQKRPGALWSSLP
jgi:hypothetical protein